MKKLLISIFFVSSLIAMESESGSDYINLAFSSPEEAADFLTFFISSKINDIHDDIIEKRIKSFKKSLKKLEDECHANNTESIKAFRDLKKACRDSNFEITTEESRKKLTDFGLIDDNYNPKSEVKALLQNKS
ncbi:hypothetical protein M1446_04570 [Candidatus Dependentiae bacterium]|nr:hypothetical protein [Candidatus Dependentiae bacterium]